jgi:hypothetical protein
MSKFQYLIQYMIRSPNVRADYHWQELWRAMLGLLDFLSNKIEALATTGGVETLAGEVNDPYSAWHERAEFSYRLLRSCTFA